jgi:hypothetical protein
MANHFIAEWAEMPFFYDTYFEKILAMWAIFHIFRYRVHYGSGFSSIIFYGN